MLKLDDYIWIEPVHNNIISPKQDNSSVGGLANCVLYTIYPLEGTLDHLLVINPLSTPYSG